MGPLDPILSTEITYDENACMLNLRKFMREKASHTVLVRPLQCFQLKSVETEKLLAKWAKLIQNCKEPFLSSVCSTFHPVRKKPDTPLFQG